MLEAQETKNQLPEVEVVTMRSKYSMAQKEMSQQHQTIRALEEKQAHLQAHCHHLEEETGFLHARLEAQGLALENEQMLVTSQLRHKEEQVATLTGKLLKAKAEAQAAEQKARRWEDSIRRLKDDLAASQLSREAAESRVQRKEEQLQGLQRKRQSLHQELKMVQSEAAQLEALLSTSQLESCSLKKELQRKDEELQSLQEQLQDSREALQGVRQGKEAIQESETQLLQRDQLVEQQKAALVAAREELSRCAGQQQQAGQLAVLRERHRTAQQEVGSKLRGDLNSAEEQLVRAKDEGRERAAEGSGLKRKLHQLQDDIRNLQEISGKREKAMAEQTCCIQQLQREQICSSQVPCGLSSGRAGVVRGEVGSEQGRPDRCSQQQALLMEQLQGELTSRERAHQAELEQLRAKLQHLQQELDVCKGKNQDNRSHLQQREAAMERQSSHLQFLLQQCQMLKEEVSYYEAVVQEQERELCLQQEHLAVAESRSSSTESSLDLYKKYQATVRRAGELQGRVQSLEQALRDVSSQMRERDDTIASLRSKQLLLQQEMTGKRNQMAVEQLTQELHAAEEELSRSLQHTHRHEQSIRALQEQLAASQTKCLEAEEILVHVQTEFASYTATHSHSNASCERQATMAENLQQQLSRANEDCTKHSRRAEEYQCLVQDLKLELVRVAEQKNSSMKALGTLELEVQSLRQDTAAEVEQKQLEVAKLQQLVQQLECKLRESRRLCAQKEQIMQQRDEQLRQAQATMQQALQEKGLELEQQRAQARGLAARLQQAQQEREQSQAASDRLQEEIQLLRQSLQDSQRQQQAAAQELVQQEERLLLAQSSLQSTQARLSERVAEVLRLQAEQQALQEQLSRSTDEVEQSRLGAAGGPGRRKLLERLKAELGPWKQRHQVAVQQGTQHQHSVARMELKLGSSLEQAKALQQQLQEQESTQRALREELSQLQGREEELQRQLQGAQERERDEQAARSFEQQLGERSSQAQHWQRQSQENAQALAQRDEDLVVFKVELASLKEKLHGATEESARWQQELNVLRQKFVASSSEAEALRSSLGAARSDSRRLHRESELVLANVSQWVKEQKQANGKLGLKIREQIKHIAQLTGEKDHLQEVLARLQQENRQLKGEVAERRIECERLKALQGSSLEARALLRQPWPLLLGEE
ncbi:polyamine-modulated factor 1-binding protein 1 [Pangshura tecta]